jgi:antitoxin component of MazEF toxin-antitoxin module
MTRDGDEIWKRQKRDLIKVGNSIALVIHQDEREKLGELGKGDRVDITVTEDDRLIVQPDEN